MKLSYSRINTFSQCPKKYELRYEENWRLKQDRASLAFGQTVHKTLERYYQQNYKDPKIDREYLDTIFRTEWNQFKDEELLYAKGDSWEKLNQQGIEFMNLFGKNIEPIISNVQAIEKELFMDVDGVRIHGFVDMIADLDGIPTLIDFKTAKMRYHWTQKLTDEQLTIYSMLLKANDINVEQIAYIIFLKHKEPKIEILKTEPRSTNHTVSFTEKLKNVSQDIEDKKFHKEPSSCSNYGGCEYLPLCWSGIKGKENLIQIGEIKK